MTISIIAQGRDYILNTAFTSVGKTVALYVAPIGGSTPTVADSDTAASHAGWTESTAYSAGTRPAVTCLAPYLNSTTSRYEIAVPRNAAIATANASFTHYGWALYEADNTKGGTGGTLIAVQLFNSPASPVNGSSLSFPGLTIRFESEANGNILTQEGEQWILDKAFRASAFTSTLYVKALSTSSPMATTDTASSNSHVEWTNYPGSNRPQWSPIAAAGGNGYVGMVQVSFGSPTASTPTANGWAIVTAQAKGASTGTLIAQRPSGGPTSYVNGGSPIVVTPAITISAPSVSATLVQTHTVRNITGNPEVYAPHKWVIKFDPGELPATSTLELRLSDDTVVPTSQWQWGERVTYPDGSLCTAWIRAFCPSTLSNGGNHQWKVYKVSGTWPAETGSGITTADITGVTDHIIRFNSVKNVVDSTLPNPANFSTQATVGSGTLYTSLNYALGLNVLETRTDGPICRVYYTWACSRDFADDSKYGELWAMYWVEVWKNPFDGLTDIRLYSQTVNGWVDRAPKRIFYQPAIYNGSTYISDWKNTQTMAAADVDTVNSLIRTNRALYSNYADNAFAVFGGASLPTGLTAGKYYPQRRDEVNQGLFVNDIAFPLTPGSLPYSPFLRPYGKLVTYTDGGSSTFTVSKGVGHWEFCMWPLVDPDGFDYWLRRRGVNVNGTGPRIVPDWTLAEKLARVAKGLINPTSYAENGGMGATQADVGLSGHYQKYEPMAIRWVYKSAFDGGSLDGATGDTSIFFWDLMRGMGSSDHHRHMRLAAAEVGAWPLVIKSSVTNPATGREYARCIPTTSGPNRAGGNYTGLPTLFPSAWWGAGSGKSSCYYINPDVGYGGDAWTAAFNGVSGQVDGSHQMAMAEEAFALYGSYADLEAVRGKWEASTAFQSSNRARVYSGVTYRNLTMPVNAVIGNQRSEGQVARAGAFMAVMTPDTSVEKAPLWDAMKDNWEYIELAAVTDAIIGPIHRARGLTHNLSTPAATGAEQTWFMTRGHFNWLRALKLVGRNNAAVIDLLTAFARAFYGDPRAPATRSNLSAGWQKTWPADDLAMQAIRYSNFRDVSSNGVNILQDTNVRSTMDCADFMLDGAFVLATFNADSTITWPNNGATHLPLRQNGDSFVVRMSNQPVGGDAANAAVKATLESRGLLYGMRYFVYDKSGDTYKICTDYSNPSGTRVMFSNAPFSYWLQSQYTGNGRERNNYAVFGWPVYSILTALPLAGAAHWYGRTDGATAWANFLEIERRGGAVPDILAELPFRNPYRHTFSDIQTS